MSFTILFKSDKKIGIFCYLNLSRLFNDVLQASSECKIINTTVCLISIKCYLHECDYCFINLQFLTVYLSVCFSLFLSVFPSLSVSLSPSVSDCFSLSFSFCLFVSFCLFLFLSLCLSVSLYLSLFVCFSHSLCIFFLCFFLSFCLFLHLSFELAS